MVDPDAPPARPPLMNLALLALPLLASPALPHCQEPVEQEAIHDALDTGSEFLAARFRPEKRLKKRPKEREGIGMRALSLYAMLSAGVARDDPAVERLLLGLSTESFDKTYDVGCMILALSAHAPLEHLPWISKLAQDLIDWQQDKGDWGYPEGPVIDLSNTQYAALGLWKAARLGVAVPTTVWVNLAEAVFTYQDEEGGFSYTAPGKAGTGSMTTAGIGTLAICELELRRTGELEEALERRIRDSVARGVEWMTKNFMVDDNPRMGAWHYYYLYGLERMSGLTGLSHIGEHDWYQEGARLLVDDQDKEGSWKGGTDLSETSFALLFLKRATAPEPLGRRPESGERARENRQAARELAESSDVLLGTGQRAGDPEDPRDGSVHLYVEQFTPRVRQQLEWAGERGLGPHVERVEYLLGERTLAVVLADSKRAAGSAGFNARVFLPEIGKHEVTARIHVLAQTAEGEPEARTIVSAPLEVEARDSLPDWVTEFSRGGVNLTPGSKPKARGSSELKKSDSLPIGDYSAEFVTDGRPQTPWLTKPGDDSPEINVTYRKAPKTSSIRLHMARLPSLPRDAFARPAQLEVKLNGKDRFTVDVPEDPRQPAVIDLAEAKKVKRIDVEFVGLQLDETSEARQVTGLGEIELIGEPGDD